MSPSVLSTPSPRGDFALSSLPSPHPLKAAVTLFVLVRASPREVVALVP